MHKTTFLKRVKKRDSELRDTKKNTTPIRKAKETVQKHILVNKIMPHWFCYLWMLVIKMETCVHHNVEALFLLLEDEYTENQRQGIRLIHMLMNHELEILVPTSISLNVDKNYYIVCVPLLHVPHIICK